MSTVYTIGDLRRHFNQPTHVLDYAIERFGPAPASRVGSARVWTDGQLAEIQESLKRTAERSTRRHAEASPV